MGFEALLPLNVEKRHDFYGYPFYIGIHDNDVEDEQDRLALTQINNVFRNLLNAKYFIASFSRVASLLLLLFFFTEYFWFFCFFID